MQWWSELIPLIFPQICDYNMDPNVLLIYCNQVTSLLQAIYLCPCIIHNESIRMPITFEHRQAFL
jgi:hypothetical protein